MENLHIIILAAGKGTRMRSELPKVLHPLAGKPLLAHVIETAEKLNPISIKVIIGDSKEKVRETCKNFKVEWVEQTEQLGTGHAVMQAIPQIPENDKILILYGDVPLTPSTLLQEFMMTTPPFALGVITTQLKNPHGFGRIIRDKQGNVCTIVEQKDADNDQQEIKEINTGILFASCELFKKYLPRLNKNNAQNEYYLTDIIKMSYQDGVFIAAFISEKIEEVLGINDRTQLASLERYYQIQTTKKLMLAGVTIIDPTRFDLRGEAIIANDVIIDINVVLEGKIEIATQTTIGANCVIKNTKIGRGVEIKPNCVIEDTIIEDNCIIGPFARVRPGSHFSSGVHIGNFVECKNTKIGKGSKANHLTYLGDTVIGEKVNVGAGTITCNYDGANKHITVIEDGAFIGSNVALVAPVTVGKNATIGAGSVITANAPANKLSLCRAKQAVVEDWVRPVKK